MTTPHSPSATPRRIAVVGAGYFSQFHLEGWAHLKGVQVVALCDSDPIKAATLAARYGVAQIFDNVAGMLASASPDLVDVVTPPASHQAVLTELFKHGPPVICQKPFGQDYAQALALTEAAKQSGIPLVVHENFRFMPCYREAKRCIEAGMLGTLHGISFRLRTGDGQGPSAYLDRQPYFQTMPRLLVAETAIHFIDTFRYLVGEVSAVYARLRKLNPVIAGEDAALISFEFEGGAAGVFDGNRLNDHSAANPRRTLGEMWLEGARGVLRLDGDARLWFKPHHGPEAEHVYERGSETTFGGGACGALQQHVINAFANGTAPENTAQDYLRNLLIQEAVYASHASGQRIAMASFSPSLSSTHALETV
jgi:D-apiose dehydrogenase